MNFAPTLEGDSLINLFFAPFREFGAIKKVKCFCLVSTFNFLFYSIKLHYICSNLQKENDLFPIIHNNNSQYQKPKAYGQWLKAIRNEI